MAEIKWDQGQDRIFDVGLDQGVLYLEDGLSVPWNGLTQVTHEAASQNTEPLFFDGKKYADLQTRGGTSVKISAFTYPDEFSAYFGVLETESGLYIPSQDKKTFSMSYRTLIGDDTTEELGYRYHILYNLTAVMDGVQHETQANGASLIEFEWAANAQEEKVPGYFPTAYVVADSRELPAGALQWLCWMLYGNEFIDPFLPSLEALIERLANSYIITFTDNGDGTWTADTPELFLTMVSPTQFVLDGTNATYSDAYTYTVSSA